MTARTNQSSGNLIMGWNPISADGCGCWTACRDTAHASLTSGEVKKDPGAGTQH